MHPVIGNRLDIAMPKARPTTRLSRFLVQLTREMGERHHAEAPTVGR